MKNRKANKLLLGRDTLRTLVGNELARAIGGDDGPYQNDPSLDSGGGGGNSGGSGFTHGPPCFETQTHSICICG